MWQQALQHSLCSKKTVLDHKEKEEETVERDSEHTGALDHVTMGTQGH